MRPHIDEIFQQLVKSRFVRAVRVGDRGYVFARPPDEIRLLELFEAVEGAPLFDDCFLKHCECGGTRENCRILSLWAGATRQIMELHEETTVAAAAWNHPRHRFLSLLELLAGPKGRVNRGRERS